MKLESILEYIDEYLGVTGHPDYSTALNGLQVGGPDEVRHIVAAVDASQASAQEAVKRGADLLLVHHGMFWDGLAPITGRRLGRLRPLLRNDVALYSVHLPLDAHEEVGNCAILARKLGLEIRDRFGTFEGTKIGWWGTTPEPWGAEELRERVARAVDGPAQLLPGGPDEIRRVGVVTGGGGGFIPEAARAGLDALVTGEGAHHTYLDAMEMGVHTVYGGHYATEVFGVQALARHLAEKFDLTWEFADLPSGL